MWSTTAGRNISKGHFYRRFAMSTKAKSKAKPQTASRVLETIYETAADLERLGFIDKRKMQKLDALCMEPIAPLTAPKSAPCASNITLVKR
jgi:hypothetical protein